MGPPGGTWDWDKSSLGGSGRETGGGGGLTFKTLIRPMDLVELFVGVSHKENCISNQVEFRICSAHKLLLIWLSFQDSHFNSVFYFLLSTLGTKNTVHHLYTDSMTLEPIFTLKVLWFLSALQLQNLDFLNFSLLTALKLFNIAYQKTVP